MNDATGIIRHEQTKPPNYRTIKVQSQGIWTDGYAASF